MMQYHILVINTDLFNALIQTLIIQEVFIISLSLHFTECMKF